MASLEDEFPTGKERLVDTPEGRVALVVSSVAEGVPRPVTIRCGPLRGLLRIAGSVGNLSDANQQALFEFTVATFSTGDLGKLGLMSGGTRVLGRDGQVTFSALELPRLIRKWHPNCRTLGSLPRTTETMSLIGEHSTFVPADRLDSRTLVNPGIDLVWIVQTSASEYSPGYDQDVPLYFDLMDDISNEGGATGLFVWGGGKVTAKEVHTAILRRHACAVVPQSGRLATDLFLMANGHHGDVSQEHFSLLRSWHRSNVDFGWIDFVGSPAEMQVWLDHHGFYV